MNRRLQVNVVILALLVGIVGGRMADNILRADAYSYFDTLVDVRSELVRHYVEEPEEDEMLKGAIKGMVEALNDPFTDYLAPEDLEQFDRQTRATFSGIGAEISAQDGQIMIVSPLEDSPAFEAGIMAGDIILEINGESTEGLSTQDAVQKITGPRGTEVTLKVRHPDGEEAEITIVRQQIDVQTVRGFRRDAENHWNYLLDPEAGVGYVRVSQFASPTTDALKEAVKQAQDQGMKGLILDLRFNPGGLLDQAVAMSDMFLSEGTILSTRGRNSPHRAWEAEPGNGLTDFPMIILVNEFSASASEIVAGALRDNNRATVLGTRSFGKGSVQQVMKLESGAGALKVTTAYYYLPSGRNLHRREGATEWGVDPNDGFYVPMSNDQIRKMTELRRDSDIIRNRDGEEAERITPDLIEDELSDPQLAAALQAMLGKFETGEFPRVGESEATLTAHVNERSTMERRREVLSESLEQVDESLRQLDESIAEINGDNGDNDAEAEVEPEEEVETEAEPATP
ncbi:MAG: S41 family peptidase [Phycisphaeraceae bacterium]